MNMEVLGRLQPHFFFVSGMCVFWSSETVIINILSITCDEQNTATPVKGILTEHEKRSFEVFSNWTVTETCSRTRRWRKKPLEVDG